MANVYVFNKKVVHSLSKNKDFYFLCLRDKEGYAADQIVNQSVFEAVDPPCQCDLDFHISNGKVYFDIVPVK